MLGLELFFDEVDTNRWTRQDRAGCGVQGLRAENIGLIDLCEDRLQRALGKLVAYSKTGVVCGVLGRAALRTRAGPS